MTDTMRETHTPIAVSCEELELILDALGQGTDLPGNVVRAIERVRGCFPAKWVSASDPAVPDTRADDDTLDEHITIRDVLGNLREMVDAKNHSCSRLFAEAANVPFGSGPQGAREHAERVRGLSTSAAMANAQALGLLLAIEELDAFIGPCSNYTARSWSPTSATPEDARCAQCGRSREQHDLRHRQS